jgi:type VI secretion system ImpB/VipA family protein
MPESIQHKLDRVRPPRVQITYDVETLGSIVKTQLPFVVGIMADLSGNGIDGNTPDKTPPALKERKYVEIDRDNFNMIMKKTAPTVKVKGVPLKFAKLDDFDPINVLGQVDALKTKFESRTRLSNLLAKLDGNPDLQEELMKKVYEFINSSSSDQTALTNYINSRLHPSGKAGAKADLAALIVEISKDKAKMKRLKAYIVEMYGNRITPSLTDLVTSVNAGQHKDELKTYIAETYPYTLDLPALIVAVTVPADKTTLNQYIKDTYKLTVSNPEETPDLGSLTEDQKTDLKKYIAVTYKATVTPPDPSVLVRSLTSADKDALKSYIVANFEPTGRSTVLADAQGHDLTYLVNSLSDADQKKLQAYIEGESEYQDAVKASIGGTNQ